MAIFLTMICLGFLLGFAGGGGSGFVLALLVSVFNTPIHTALGTSIAAMFFTVLVGAASQMRSGGVAYKLGSIVGICGAAGAYGGSKLAAQLPSGLLIMLSAGMLFVSAFFIWYKTRKTAVITFDQKVKKLKWAWLSAPMVGFITGSLSGTLGIGATPLIQLGLLMLLGFSIREAAGTSMFIILPIALFGSIGYIQSGNIDYSLLTLIVLGTMSGSYIGAKWTHKAPVPVLRSALIVLPITGGVLLLL